MPIHLSGESVVPPSAGPRISHPALPRLYNPQLCIAENGMPAMAARFIKSRRKLLGTPSALMFASFEALLAIFEYLIVFLLSVVFCTYAVDNALERPVRQNPFQPAVMPNSADSAGGAGGGSGGGGSGGSPASSVDGPQQVLSSASDVIATIMPATLASMLVYAYFLVRFSHFFHCDSVSLLARLGLNRRPPVSAVSLILGAFLLAGLAGCACVVDGQGERPLLSMDALLRVVPFNPAQKASATAARAAAAAVAEAEAEAAAATVGSRTAAEEESETTSSSSSSSSSASPGGENQGKKQQPPQQMSSSSGGGGGGGGSNADEKKRQRALLDFDDDDDDDNDDNDGDGDDEGGAASRNMASGAGAAGGRTTTGNRGSALYRETTAAQELESASAAQERRRRSKGISAKPELNWLVVPLKLLELIMMGPAKEELVVRGIGFHLLFNRYPQPLVCSLSSSLLYASMHLVNLSIPGSSATVVFALLHFVQSILFGSLMCSRLLLTATMWEPLVIHTVYKVLLAFVVSEQDVDPQYRDWLVAVHLGVTAIIAALLATSGIEYGKKRALQAGSKRS